MGKNEKSRSFADFLKQKTAIVAIVIALLLATGCSSAANSSDSQAGYSSSSQATQSYQASASETNDDDESDDFEEETDDDSADSSSTAAESNESTSSSNGSKLANTTSSVKNGIPAVLGTNWESQSDGLYYTNDKEPAFTSAQKKGRKSFEDYSSLDNLGRCGAATACIGLDIMPTGGRGSISEVKPTGWHTYEYDFINGGYLYNRCHLIAYSLAGENANERNLITGTRQMNEAMIMFENIVNTYVTGSGNHCLYRVTPIFLKNNLVAHGVHMEAYSVEDKGARVKFNVYIPNKQDKVKINYATGESSLKSGATSSSKSKSSSGSASKSSKSTSSKKSSSGKSGSSASASKTYVLNTSSKKFHYSDCSAVKRMADHNKSVVKMTRSAIIAQGYDPCGICHP